MFLATDGNQWFSLDVLAIALAILKWMPNTVFVSNYTEWTYDYTGWGGIRTRGTFRYTRFPGVPNRPLWHPSCRR